jgi:hypothetical protein
VKVGSERKKVAVGKGPPLSLTARKPGRKSDVMASYKSTLQVLEKTFSLLATLLAGLLTKRSLRNSNFKFE